MGFMPLEEDFGLEINPKLNYDEGIVEEIRDVIRVCKNGLVERTSIVHSVSPFLAPDLNVIARDVYIDRETNVWARTYVPKCDGKYKFPLLVYFHGGGFCVGSTAWKCYHDFLGNLSSKSRCIIVSVNYRLAPENRLPAAYEDGIKALMWVKQLEGNPSSEYWVRYCDFSSIFLGGDSAGANIAYNVALKLDTPQIIMPLINLKGIIMVQPFFGGEQRTNSEKFGPQSSKSKSNVTAYDAYWRLALPLGASRDHPWCDPLRKDAKTLTNTRVMVCVAGEDVLRDRNMEFCLALANQRNHVEQVICQGVGHAFHVVDKSQLSEMRQQDLISDIVAFITT